MSLLSTATMKKWMTLSVIALAMVSFAGSNMKAYIIGYDQNIDFSAIKTFAYYEPLKDSIAPGSWQGLAILLVGVAFFVI